MIAKSMLMHLGTSTTTCPLCYTTDFSIRSSLFMQGSWCNVLLMWALGACSVRLLTRHWYNGRRLTDAISRAWCFFCPLHSWIFFCWHP